MPFMHERRVRYQAPARPAKALAGSAGTSPPRGRETRNQNCQAAGLGLLETWSILLGSVVSLSDPKNAKPTVGLIFKVSHKAKSLSTIEAMDPPGLRPVVFDRAGFVFVQPPRITIRTARRNPKNAVQALSLPVLIGYCAHFLHSLRVTHSDKFTGRTDCVFDARSPGGKPFGVP